MKTKSHFFALFLIALSLQFNKSNAQAIPNKQAYFYAGFDINLATFSSATSVKTLFGVKMGYNKLISKNFYAGPQLNTVFIKSPVNKGARISLFAGPSCEMEVKRIGADPPASSQSLSSRLSWVFPLNPVSSDFTYMDCISLSTSLSNDEFFGFKKSSVDININFQGYDVGFYKGLSRMITISTGSRTTF